MSVLTFAYFNSYFSPPVAATFNVFAPIPCNYTSLPLDGMARYYHFYLRGYARARNFVMSGSIFILISYTREKNHLDKAGIEPGLPAPQASMLSITPLPLGQATSKARLVWIFLCNR